MTQVKNYKIIQITRNAYSSCHVLLNTLKGTCTAITLPEIILYYSTLSGTNLQILTPKRYDKHSRHFYREVPHGPSWSLRGSLSMQISAQKTPQPVVQGKLITLPGKQLCLLTCPIWQNPRQATFQGFH